ncbi:ATP-binding protein [Chroococcidiopsis sp. TS-821]|uniref:ATP-binding protein n=1 Tax=Chroococcidiopsis sp. TS-821 TaxID=1378066 RepID=UPI000D425630|nr:DUF87 domain-containing protein [Chroococcidiopsis sp. TS-821]PPS41918.1 cell division protein FtsK [Chroococcidiopsis sp. TS-821]
MFQKKAKPLPEPVLKVVRHAPTASPTVTSSGIQLGENIYWNPELLPNAHIAIIGASGSGKTQTLKAIAYEASKVFSLQIFIVDFHGDQQLEGEVCYHLDMESPHGINPLTIDKDTKGGGPALQAIAVAAILKKALSMGPNQEGLVIEVLNSCYTARGIVQSDPKSWEQEPPTFAELKAEVEQRIEEGCKESQKLLLKLAATFQYGIFNRPQPPLNAPIIRFDLSALGKVPGLGAIAAESLAKQLMDSHRLHGEIEGKIPRTFLFIDEAKEMSKSLMCDRITADGRKYGLALVLASQSERHMSSDVIGNSATKIVLPVDQAEVKSIAKKFRFAEERVARLSPLQALCRFGKDAMEVDIVPYFQRLEGEK